MSDITQLAFAQLTDADRLAVQLIRPRLPDVERMLHPTVVRIIWPTQPTIVDARAFQETAAVVAKLRGCQYRTLHGYERCTGISGENGRGRGAVRTREATPRRAYLEAAPCRALTD